MKKLQIIICSILALFILVALSNKPIRRLLISKGYYYIYRTKEAKKQIKYFNFPKLFKEGYILLHYTSLGRFYFYHPEKKEFKNIAFLPVKSKEIFLDSPFIADYYDCLSNIHFYTDEDCCIISYIEDRMANSTLIKGIKTKQRTFYNHDPLYRVQLYIIKNEDNAVLKKETINSRYNLGYVKYNNEYYTFRFTNYDEYTLIKQNRNNEVEEVTPLTCNSCFDSHPLRLVGEILKYDDAHIYLCSYIDNGNSDIRYAFDSILCDINLEERTVTQCNRNKLIYNNIEFIWNQEMKETIMYNKDGKFIFEGPINDGIDRIRWVDVYYNWTPQIFPWEINISFDKKYIAITKSIKDIEDKANQIRNKDFCKLVRVEKYLYNLETKECEIVSFDTLVDTRVEMSSSQLFEEEEYLRYEGFETIRGKVVNGKFVKIKRSEK